MTVTETNSISSKMEMVFNMHYENRMPSGTCEVKSEELKGKKKDKAKVLNLDDCVMLLEREKTESWGGVAGVVVSPV